MKGVICFILQEKTSSCKEFHLKMKDLFLLKEMLLPRDLMFKIGWKDAYFTISSAKKLSVIREIPVGKKSIPILVPTFWSYCSSKNIYEKTLHPDHNLLRYYAFHGSYPKWTFNASGFSYTAEFGFPKLTFKNQCWTLNRL